MLMLCMLRCGNWAVEVADGASPQLPSPPRSLGAAHRLALVSTTPASRRLLFFGKVTSTDEELSSGVLDTRAFFFGSGTAQIFEPRPKLASPLSTW